MHLSEPAFLFSQSGQLNAYKTWIQLLVAEQLKVHHMCWGRMGEGREREGSTEEIVRRAEGENRVWAERGREGSDEKMTMAPPDLPSSEISSAFWNLKLRENYLSFPSSPPFHFFFFFWSVFTTIHKTHIFLSSTVTQESDLVSVFRNGCI